MKTNQAITLHSNTNEVQEITKEYVQGLFIRMFNALEDATGDTVTAVTVIEKITEGIEADPEFSKQVLTPENIGKCLELKKKSDAGTIKLTDIEDAFPALVEKVPFWSIVKTFVK